MNQPQTPSNEDLTLDDITLPTITDDPKYLGLPTIVLEMSPDEAEQWGAMESDPIELEEAWKDAINDNSENVI